MISIKDVRNLRTKPKDDIIEMIVHELISAIDAEILSGYVFTKTGDVKFYVSNKTLDGLTEKSFSNISMRLNEHYLSGGWINPIKIERTRDYDEYHNVLIFTQRLSI